MADECTSGEDTAKRGDEEGDLADVAETLDTDEKPPDNDGDDAEDRRDMISSIVDEVSEPEGTSTDATTGRATGRAALAAADDAADTSPYPLDINAEVVEDTMVSPPSHAGTAGIDNSRRVDRAERVDSGDDRRDFSRDSPTPS